MKKICASIVMVGLTLVLILPTALAEVRWQIDKTLSLSSPPVDTAASFDGKWLFVLTKEGNIEIYKSDGTLQDTIAVGPHVDGIQTGPNDSLLYLQSRKKKTVALLTLDFIHDFDLTGSPVKGPADAPVTIVEYSDFQCPYCGRMSNLMDQVLKKNPETVKLVFKHFPLSSHRFALQAALATMAAHREGKFWPFHDQLFANYNQLSDQKIEEIAQEMGFEQEAFKKMLQDPALLEQIKRDYQQGVEAGVRGTPTLYINGQLVRDRSLEGIQSMIDNALKNHSQKP